MPFISDASAAVSELHQSPDKILVVVALNDDELSSAQFSRALRTDEANEEPVLSFLNNSNCICLRVNRGTDDYNNFNELYPVIECPSWFVIRSDGTVACEVAGSSDLNELADDVNETFEVIETELQECKKAQLEAEAAVVQAALQAKQKEEENKAKAEAPPKPTAYTASDWVTRSPSARPSYLARLTPEATIAKSAKTKRAGGDVASLAIRQLDGSKLYTQAAASGTVREVVSYIDTERTDGGGRYVLKCRFPDRTLSSKQSAISLTDVGLVPSGTLFLCAPSGTEEADAFGVAAARPVFAVSDGSAGGFFVWVWVTGFVNWLVGLVSSVSAGRIGGQAAGVAGTASIGSIENTVTGGNEPIKSGEGVRGVRTLHDGNKQSSDEGEGNKKKRNEYFGGDSTVFQGRDSDDE